MEGTIDESGESHDSTNYTASMSDSGDGVWKMTQGTQTQKQSGSGTSSYDADGDFADLVGSNFVFGDQSASGSASSSYGSTTNFNVQNGAWHDSNGYGWTLGDSETHDTYSGSGDYSSSSSTGNLSGTISENGSDDTTSHYNTDSFDADGAWSQFGDQDDTANGDYHSDYSGSGSYTTNYQGATISGSQSGSGSVDSEYNDDKSYSNTNGVWSQYDGSSYDGESDESHVHFSGSGSYQTPSSVGSAADKVNGTLNLDGGEDTTADEDILGGYDDGAWDDSGYAIDTDKTHSNGSFSGSGTYSQWFAGFFKPGNLTETANVKSSYGTTIEYSYDNGWIAEDGWGKESQSGSVNKTYAKDEAAYSIYAGGYNIGGTASDEGTVVSSFGENANLTLDTTGNFALSDGTKWSKSKSTDTTAYNGKGMSSYSVPGAPLLYTNHDTESGSTETVITQVNGWDVSNGVWVQNTSYNDYAVTTNTQYFFKADVSYGTSSAAPSDGAGTYTMQVSANETTVVDTETSDGTTLITSTAWGHGDDSYQTPGPGTWTSDGSGGSWAFSLNDHWSMPQPTGGQNAQNHVWGSYGQANPPSYDHYQSTPGFGGVPGWDGSYYMGQAGLAGNATGLNTPYITGSAYGAAVTPPYNVPPTIRPSGNLSAQQQAMLNQINADASADALRPDDGSLWTDYKYYLFNPSKMDSDLYTGAVVTWSVAGVAGGGAVGLVAGAAVIGATAATIGCPAATLAAGFIGSGVGTGVGGAIGSWGGPTSQVIGAIGGGILGGFTGGACFAAGTQVVVGINPDGTYITKNIEDIQVGDYVLSRSQSDPNAPLEYKQVTAVYVHQVTEEQLLTVTDAQGNTETITCTTEHPFWVPGQGWTAAGDLTPGTELTSPDGSMVVVVDNTSRALAQPANVYNFEVDGDHTYFVDEGAEPVWVHNTCDPVHGNSALSPKTTVLYKLVDKTGKFLKWGISQNPAGRYSKAFMEGKELIRVTQGARSLAHDDCGAIYDPIGTRPAQQGANKSYCASY